MSGQTLHEREPGLTPGELLDLRRRLEAERVARAVDLQRQVNELQARQAGMTEAEVLAAELAILYALRTSETLYKAESAAADDMLQESERFAPLDQLESAAADFGWLDDREPLAVHIKDLWQ